jgi:hypothetical protein
MKPAVWRLLATAALFILWIGYLLYLWLCTLHFRPLPPGYPDTMREPLVLSRPQIEAAPLIVVAEVKDVDSPVVVEEVLVAPAELNIKKGDELTVSDLKESRRARPPDWPRDQPDPPPDFTGPGRYLLPLEPKGEKTAEVVAIPPSPRYYRDGGPRRIYPATPEVLAEYRSIPR